MPLLLRLFISFLLDLSDLKDPGHRGLIALYGLFVFCTVLEFLFQDSEPACRRLCLKSSDYCL